MVYECSIFRFFFTELSSISRVCETIDPHNAANGAIRLEQSVSMVIKFERAGQTGWQRNASRLATSKHRQRIGQRASSREIQLDCWLAFLAKFSQLNSFNWIIGRLDRCDLVRSFGLNCSQTIQRFPAVGSCRRWLQSLRCEACKHCEHMLKINRISEIDQFAFANSNSPISSISLIEFDLEQLSANFVG